MQTKMNFAARNLSHSQPNRPSRPATDEAALDYIGMRIAPKSGGSVKVIAERLRFEKVWSSN